MLHFSLVVAHFQTYLLVFLSLRVEHPNFKLAVCRLRIVPILPNASDYLLSLMHGLYSKLQKILLIHLNQVHSGDMMFLNESLNLILPRISQGLC